MKTSNGSFLKGVFAYDTKDAKVLNGTSSTAIQKSIQALVNEPNGRKQKTHANPNPKIQQTNLNIHLQKDQTGCTPTDEL